MRNIFRAALIGSTFLAVAAHAEDGPVLSIENFIGTIYWTQTDSTAISAELVENKRNSDIMATQTGNGIAIDGRIDRLNTKSCQGYMGKYSFSWGNGEKADTARFGGYKNLKDYPVLEIKLPTDAHVRINDSIPFVSGRPNVQSFEADLRGCGDVEIGDIRDDLALDSSGSTDFVAGNVGRAAIDISGSGDLELGDVRELRLEIRGSGDAEVGESDRLTAEMSGSGDMEFGDVSQQARIESRGSGDVSMRAVSGSLEYISAGSGDIEVDAVTGRLDVSISGSGDASFRGSDLTRLDARASGSSDISVRGRVVDAELRASGSSDIYVERVTGELSERDTGAADIRVKYSN